VSGIFNIKTTKLTNANTKDKLFIAYVSKRSYFHKLIKHYECEFHTHPIVVMSAVRVPLQHMANHCGIMKMTMTMAKLTQEIYDSNQCMKQQQNKGYTDTTEDWNDHGKHEQ